MGLFQATYQGAGANGVRNILEKLLLTVKFDIPGRGDVRAVEVTEDFVLGKAPPIYHYKHQMTTEELYGKDSDSVLEGGEVIHDDPLNLTEVEELIFEQLEL